MRATRVVPIVIAVAIVGGAAVFVAVNAALGTAPTAPPAGSKFSDHQRPFGPTAAWNVPVAGLARDPRSDMWRDRFWNYAIYNEHPDNPGADGIRGKHGIMFGLDADPNLDFSVAVFDARDATSKRRVRQRDSWNGEFNIGPDETIPWNPGWRASTGSDGIMLILDPSTGRHWSLWGLVQRDANGRYNDSQCLGHKIDGTGYDRATDLCAGGASLLRNADDSVADYRSFAGNDPGARGVGIPELAMLTFPEEVARGAIQHALMMPTYNTMAGPACGPSIAPDDPSLGDTCGRAFAPAGGYERRDGTTGCGLDADKGVDEKVLRQRTIPEGIRFALDISDADIDKWLDSRGYSDEVRSTAKVFATALRDYGWFVTDTSCFAADSQVAGSSNPATGAAWRGLGIKGDGRDLLYGLFTKDRIVTLAPAINHCVDGTTSRLDCHATSTGYR